MADLVDRNSTSCAFMYLHSWMTSSWSSKSSSMK